MTAYKRAIDSRMTTEPVNRSFLQAGVAIFTERDSSSKVLIAVIIAVLIRLSVFAVTSFYPITADSGVLISPGLANGTDINFYQKQRHAMFSVTENNWLAASLVMPKLDRAMIAGPVVPILLYWFQYESGNSWPLATLYLIGSICLTLLWIKWFYEQGIDWPWLILFAIIPNPIFYMLCVGTELPFSVFFATFFFAYFKPQWTKRDIYVWSISLLLCLLTRPNGFSILLFVVIDLVVRNFWSKSFYKSAFPLLLIAVLLFGLFFSPYLLDVQKNSIAKTFFGIPAYQYLKGIFPILPGWLNQICSIVLLLPVKMLYFLGLRPSYSNVSIIYVIMRGFPGLLLLPGFVYLCWKGDTRHKYLFILFILPIMIVGSQDRYNVPIQPLLFFYSVKALSRMLGTQKGYVWQ